MFLIENVNTKLAEIAIAFSAGSITYVGASELIPVVNKTKSRLPPLLVFGDMMLFYPIEKILELVLQ